MSQIIDLTNQHANDAADGIVKIIEAGAKAKQSQIDLEKTLMLDQISRQRNRQDKQQEQQDQINNWGKMFGSDSTPQGDPNSNATGMANGQTPNQVGTNPASPISPIGGAMPQGGYTAQQPPPMSMADGSNQPQIQQEVAQQAQQPQVVPPVVPAQAQPTVQPVSSQFTDLGFTPIGLGQLAMARKGQPEAKDYAYIQALNKVKQGKASPGEVDLVKEFNGVKNTSEALSLKKTAEQDKLETAAVNRLSSVRGDAPMAKIEVQRDAAISAYNTLQTAESQKRLPTQIEYLDILGQLWKARTGSAPTEQVLKELNVGTMQQKINKLGQYFSGTPTSANTSQVIASLKDFVKSTGVSLDQTHDGYFQTHAIKPKGLDQATWDELKNVHRGNSFQEGIDKYKTSLDAAGNQASSYKAGETRIIKGITYTRDANGNWSSQ